MLEDVLSATFGFWTVGVVSWSSVCGGCAHSSSGSRMTLGMGDYNPRTCTSTTCLNQSSQVGAPAYLLLPLSYLDSKHQHIPEVNMRTKMDLLSAMPTELLLKILSELNPRALIRSRSVSATSRRHSMSKLTSRVHRYAVCSTTWSCSPQHCSTRSSSPSRAWTTARPVASRSQTADSVSESTRPPGEISAGGRTISYLCSAVACGSFTAGCSRRLEARGPFVLRSCPPRSGVFPREIGRSTSVFRFGISAWTLRWIYWSSSSGHPGSAYCHRQRLLYPDIRFPREVYRVHLLQLSTGKKHPDARESTIVPQSQPATNSSFAIQISGKYLGVLFNSGDGDQSQLLVWNWKTAACDLVSANHPINLSY